jgi:DNA replication and repair protein RecF
MISSLRLHNFRNYLQEDLSFSANIVIFFGENGVGKTNLLEAVSMFAVGNGLRGSKIQELSRQQTIESPSLCGTPGKQEVWAVNMALDDNVLLTTGASVAANNSFRRVCKIQGSFVRSAAFFHEYLNIISITPLLDLLFVGPANVRRSFVDGFICSYDCAHNTNLCAYEKAAKQRLAILKKIEKPDEKWLASLEDIMAEKGVAVSAARRDFVQLLQDGQDEYLPLFPRFTSKIVGESEGLGKDELVKRLKQNRGKDGICAMTTLGCHRSDWVVTHVKNNRMVRDCSTGEQKITLISVVLSFVNKKTRESDKLLVLLLDDVTARLDHQHRSVLFEQVHEYGRGKERRMGGGVQVFFSGTDLESFSGATDAQFLEVGKSRKKN